MVDNGKDDDSGIWDASIILNSERGEMENSWKSINERQGDWWNRRNEIFFQILQLTYEVMEVKMQHLHEGMDNEILKDCWRRQSDELSLHHDREAENREKVPVWNFNSWASTSERDENW